MSSKIYFTCSFDDGDVYDLRLTELLVKYKLRGTLYIPRFCDLVSANLSSGQIRELSAVVEIGGHTLNHQVLTRIQNNTAQQEIFGCKSWLEDITGNPVTSFCPPTGRFNKYHIEQQRAAGFKLMRTVEMLSYSLSSHKQIGDFVVMPTTVQSYDHQKIAYLRNSFKRFRFNHYFLLEKLFEPDWEVMSEAFLAYLEKFSALNRQPVVFHLWGHSWEIEKYALWNRLERFFSRISQLDNIVTCDNKGLSEYVRSHANER